MSEFLSTKFELYDILTFGLPTIILVIGFTKLFCKKPCNISQEPSEDAKKIVNSLENLDNWSIMYVGTIVDYIVHYTANIRIYKDGAIAKVNGPVNQMIQFNSLDRKIIGDAVCKLINRKMVEDKKEILNKLVS